MEFVLSFFVIVLLSSLVLWFSLIPCCLLSAKLPRDPARKCRTTQLVELSLFCFSSITNRSVQP